MAGASYDVGSAFLQIVPSFEGVATTIDAQAAEWGESAGEAFAESFKTVVNTELKDLDSVKIDADTTAALAKISEIKAEMEALSEDDINVTLSDEEVQAKLAELQAELLAISAEHPEINVDIDTGEAQLKLGELAAETVTTDAALDDLGGSAGGASSDIDGAGASAGESAELMGELGAAIAGVAVALVPVGGLFLGALATVPALIAGVLTGIGALYAGLEPIISTLEAFSSSKAPSSSGGSSDAAQTAISNATAERDAAYSVEQAQESLTNAQVNGAEAVTEAQQTAATATQNAAQKVIDANQQLVQSEEAVTQAQFNEQQAQEAVVAARQQAANQLQDYTDQLADNAIAQQQDQLNLQEAQQALAEAMDPGTTATYDQQQQAQINVEQAQQAIQDLGDQNSQLQQTATQAFAAGVDGAQNVIEAENALQQATLAVSNAIQQQGDDQTAASQAAQAYAQQQITNQQNIAKAQQQNAQGVANAEKTLEQALANQKSAFETSKLPVDDASTSVQSYTQDFAKLTPQGKEFVDFVERQLEPAFDGISKGAQKALLPSLQSGLTAMLPFFKTLAGDIDDAAGGIGKFFDKLGAFTGSSTGLDQLQQLFANGNDAAGGFGSAVLTFLEGFVSVGSQSKPIIDAFDTGLNHIADAFLKWSNDGGFQGFLTWLKENGPAIVSDLGDMFKGFGDFVVAVTPLGIVFDNLFGFIWDIISAASPLIKVIGDVEQIVLSLWTGSGDLDQMFDQLGDDLETLGSKFSSVWGDIENYARTAWSDLKTDLFDPIDNFFTVTLAGDFTSAIGFFKNLPSEAANALGDFATTVWSKIELAGSWLDTNIWDPIADFFEGLPDKIGQAAEGMWNGISAAFATVYDDIVGWWNDLKLSIPAIHVLGVTLFPGVTVQVPQIPLIPVPKYHTGGVVQGEPGVEQLAMLMPGEIVTPASMPLPNSLGSSSGAPVLYLTINGLDLTNRGMVEEVVTDAFAQWADELGPEAA